MTLMQIWKLGLKDVELAKVLKDNGWSMIDYMYFVEFQKGQGRA